MVWLALVLLVVCSGTISGSETALFGMPRQVLWSFRKSRAPLKRQVFRLMQHPHRVLMTVLMTNTAVNVAIFAVTFISLQRNGNASPTWAAVGSIASLVAVIVFGEIVPKVIALSNTHRLAPTAGVIIASLEIVLKPVQWLLATMLVNPVVRLLTPAIANTAPVTPEELRLLVEHSSREGVIDSKENEMLQAVVALGHVSVREVMTPRVDLTAVRINDHPRVAMETARSVRVHGLLVYGRDLDDIRGLVSRRDVFLNPHTPIAKLLRPIRFVPEQINLVQLIRCFQTDKIRRAIVVDEYGGTAGFVSTGDVAEWIVGGLPFETGAERAPVTERVDNDTYRLRGDLSVRVWADQFGIREIDRHVDTVAGLILSKLGRLPRVGDAVRIRNLTLTVERIRNRRIERVLLRRAGNGVLSTDDEP